MQMVEINSKNVDSITREGKTYLYFTAGFSPFAAATFAADTTFSEFPDVLSPRNTSPGCP